MKNFRKVCRYFAVYLSMTNLVVGEVAPLGCGSHMDYLVSGPRGIPDEGISVSSSFADSVDRIRTARLYIVNGYGAWSPKYNTNQEYIQVAFSRAMVVCAVLTQGRQVVDQWVTSYKVKYSTDGETWQPVTNTENGEIFQGNSDRSTVVRNSFNKCVEASYMKINPQTWEAAASLRIDFHGCTKERSSFLSVKGTSKTVIWKRITKMNYAGKEISQQRMPHLGSCAITCHQIEHCTDYVFYPGDNTCNLLRKDLQYNKVMQEGYHLYVNNREYIAEAYDYKTIQISNDIKIYYKIITEKETKQRAAQVCADDDARLLVINNIETITSIHQTIQNSSILAQETEYFVNGEYNGVTWVIETGEEIPAVLWPSSQPPSNNDGNCVIITTNGLHAQECISQLYFVCQLLI